MVRLLSKSIGPRDGVTANIVQIIASLITSAPHPGLRSSREAAVCEGLTKQIRGASSGRNIQHRKPPAAIRLLTELPISPALQPASASRSLLTSCPCQGHNTARATTDGGNSQFISLVSPCAALQAVLHTRRRRLLGRQSGASRASANVLLVRSSSRRMDLWRVFTMPAGSEQRVGEALRR
jgi:hypothetical protein